MGFMADFLNKGSFPPGIMESEEANPRLQDKMSGDDANTLKYMGNCPI